MSTTAEYVLVSETLRQIRMLADNNQLVAYGSDTVRPLTPNGVVYKETTEGRDFDEGRGQRNILRPAALITYLGTIRPVDAGLNTMDDVQHRLVIQLVDDVVSDEYGLETYFKWADIIRKVIQANPYRDQIEPTLADIALVHVQAISPSSKTDWDKHQQMRRALQLVAYVRNPRT